MNAPPKILYVYCTFETAKDILSACTVRGFSPVCIKDPLLLDQNSTVSFKREELLKASITFAIGMIFSPAPPRGESPIVNAIKRWREEQRFGTQDEAEPVLRELLSRMIDHRMQQVAKRIHSWREFVQDARIIRAFSQANNLNNWQEFADNHQGIVLGFKAEESMLFGNAKPVEYSLSRPEITSIKEQLNLLYQLQKEADEEQFRELLYCRPLHKKHEMEWLSEQAAVKTSQDQSSDSLHSEFAFEAEELVNVRFGLRLSQQNRETCLSLMKKNFSEVKCYSAQLAKGKYELEFEKI